MCPRVHCISTEKRIPLSPRSLLGVSPFTPDRPLPPHYKEEESRFETARNEVPCLTRGHPSETGVRSLLSFHSPPLGRREDGWCRRIDLLLYVNNRFGLLSGSKDEKLGSHQIFTRKEKTSKLDVGKEIPYSLI